MANPLLTDIRPAVRIELAVTSNDSSEYTDEEIDRFVDEVTADISRFMPRERVHELLYTKTITAESFTSNHGTAVALANKPIEPKSEKVSLTTTDYVRDTDYTMSYITGEITVLASGSMANSTAFTITYEVSNTAFDISGITDMLVPFRVEMPISTVPRGDLGFFTWGDFLFIETNQGQTQQPLVDGNYAHIYYWAEHTAPTVSVRGSFPAFMDEVLVKGVIAYALFMKSREQVMASDTALDLMQTASTGPHAKIATALGNITTALTAITTALDKVATHSGTEAAAALAKVTTHTGEAGTALAKVATHTAEADTALAKVATHTAEADIALDKVAIHTGEADIALDKVATHSGEADTALTKVTTHTAEADAALAKVDTYLAAATNSTKAALVLIATNSIHADVNTALDLVKTYSDKAHAASADTGDIKAATDVWTDQVKHILTDSLPNAQDLIQLGDNFINDIPLGADVAGGYRRYAETALNMANQHSDRRKDFLTIATIHMSQALATIQESAQRLAGADRLITEAQGWVTLAEQFINEASERNTMSARFIEEASERNTISAMFVQEASERNTMSARFIEEASERNTIAVRFIEEAAQRNAISAMFVQEASERNTMSARFIEEAAQRNSMSAAFIAEAQGRFQKVTAYFQEADRWIAKGRLYEEEADRRVITADRLHTDAVERFRDYWEMLKSQVHTARQRSMSSKYQYATLSQGGLVPKGE